MLCAFSKVGQTIPIALRLNQERAQKYKALASCGSASIASFSCFSASSFFCRLMYTLPSSR
jgi:uncharacterized protein YdbL (DUF1318 family)